MDLQFPSGFTCRVTGGDGPAIVLYGDGGRLNADLGSAATGLRAGMALIVPLYGPRRGTCDEVVEIQNALSKLEAADKLVQAGAMKNDEYLRLAEKVKQKLFSD